MDLWREGRTRDSWEWAAPGSQQDSEGALGAERCRPGVARGSLIPVFPPNFRNIPDPSVHRGFQAPSGSFFRVFMEFWRFSVRSCCLALLPWAPLFRDPNNDSINFIFWAISCVPCGIFPKKAALRCLTSFQIH